MHVKTSEYRGDQRIECDVSVEVYTRRSLLNSYHERVTLENQPTVIVEAMGRLLNLLLDKGLLTEEEFFEGVLNQYRHGDVSLVKGK